VRRRAVADAFDPRYGARTVKRWLEDCVGGALTDLLATAPPARLRIVRLSEHDGAVAASLEPMTERPAAPGPYVLEGALDLATAALEPAVQAAAAALDRIRAAPIYRSARHAATGELRYYVEHLDDRLAALAQLLGAARAPSAPDDLSEPGTPRGLRRRARPVRRSPNRDALIAGIAEALLIERALPTLLDRDAHAATAVISRVGATAAAAGVALAARALATEGWLDEGALVTEDGAVQPLTDRAIAGLADQTLTRARDVALTLRGLFVRAALDGDHGTWMIRATAAEPDVVRVELRPCTASAADVLRAHLAARRELERVLEAGGPLPPNPDALLPVTRTLTYQPPLRHSESYRIELEDFSTGWVDRGTARELVLAIRRAWHLGWSRR
jgi:hypothetical protein